MKQLAIIAGCLIAATVTLNWLDNSTNESGFKVERAEGTNAFLPLGSPTAANVKTFVDDTVQTGKQYSYRVKAFNTAGDSGYSNTATVVVGTPTLPPDGVPGTLTVTQPAEFANMSARGQATATDTTLISGFVVGPGSPRRALVRLIGPGIGGPPFNVPDFCADPVLSFRNSQGQEIATNDNWSGQALVDAAASVSAFPLTAGSKDAALIITLAPGNYTVIARGVNNTTGVVLAEIYKLD